MTATLSYSQIRDWVKAEANFFRIHLLYFLFVPLISAVIFYGANGQFHISEYFSFFHASRAVFGIWGYFDAPWRAPWLSYWQQSSVCRFVIPVLLGLDCDWSVHCQLEFNHSFSAGYSIYPHGFWKCGMCQHFSNDASLTDLRLHDRWWLHGSWSSFVNVTSFNTS